MAVLKAVAVIKVAIAIAIAILAIVAMEPYIAETPVKSNFSLRSCFQPPPPPARKALPALKELSWKTVMQLGLVSIYIAILLLLVLEVIMLAAWLPIQIALLPLSFGWELSSGMPMTPTNVAESCQLCLRQIFRKGNLNDEVQRREDPQQVSKSISPLAG